jgi:hypothetical protein
LTQNGVLQTFSTRQWKGKQGEISTYRFANQVPMRSGEEAITVNWYEIIVTQETSGKQIYHNEFVTNTRFRKPRWQMWSRMAGPAGRLRTKNNNMLKTKGYHLEHNFGHGSQHLASFLLSLNLLAFLFHTVLETWSTKGIRRSAKS